MQHRYESLLHLLAEGSYLADSSSINIDSLTDEYFSLFSQLQKDIVESLPRAVETKKVPETGVCRLKLEYKLSPEPRCFSPASHKQLVKLTEDNTQNSSDMMNMLCKFGQHQPVFATAKDEEGIQEETYSPYAYCLLPQKRFRQYRERIIDSIEQSFASGRIRDSTDQRQKNPPSPSRVGELTVESYVHLTSSSCRSSLYVNFEDRNGLPLDAEYRLFRSVVRRDAQGKIDRPACSSSDSTIIYFTPKVAEKLVTHDLAEIGSILPLGLLAVTHLSMVKRIL